MKKTVGIENGQYDFPRVTRSTRPCNPSCSRHLMCSSRRIRFSLPVGSNRIPQSTRRAASEAEPWSSEGVRLCNFKVILLFRTSFVMRLDCPSKAPPVNVCSEAETHRLRYGRVAPRASCRSQNPGSKFIVRSCDWSYSCSDGGGFWPYTRCYLRHSQAILACHHLSDTRQPPRLQ
jgi:hypothetical protein